MDAELNCCIALLFSFCEEISSVLLSIDVFYESYINIIICGIVINVTVYCASTVNAP